MTDRRPPGWLRPTAAEPTSERPVLDARRSRSEATTAGLASAAVLGRSTVAFAREAGRCRPDPSQYRLASGSGPAGPTARPWPPSGPTPNRPTGEPATPCRAAAGRPARRPCARLLRRISAHRATQTNSRPASRTGARLRNPARRQPAPGGRSTDAAEESSAGAHTPRRCALLPSRESASRRRRRRRAPGMRTAGFKTLDEERFRPCVLGGREVRDVWYEGHALELRAVRRDRRRGGA
jgi:hypothetical protein